MFEALMSDIALTLSFLRLTDIIDIAIVAFVFYKLSSLVRETRAGTLIKGIILLLIFTWISDVFELTTINYLLRNFPARAEACS